MGSIEGSCAAQSEKAQPSYQVVGFKWKKPEGWWKPFLLLSNGQESDEPTKIDIWSTGINIKLGRKTCAGYFSGGRHFKCPDSAEVGLTSTCSACKERDDWFGCIQCSGEIAAADKSETGSYDTQIADKQTVSERKGAPNIICNNPKQRAGCERNNYWIYLAAFGGMLKVGCSYERRFFERMIEQGADFGCRLGIVRDGGYARALEQKLARYLGLPDKIHGALKQANLFGEPNKSIIEIASAIAKVADSALLELRPETFDFRHYYKLGNISLKPRPIQLVSGVRLVGDVIATKGNIIVMRTTAGIISFNAHRLVGYEAELSSQEFKPREQSS